ncbi:MAG: hypothetical protein ACLGJB_13625, partial [Blastocatellia bacterium]
RIFFKELRSSFDSLIGCAFLAMQERYSKKACFSNYFVSRALVLAAVALSTLAVAQMVPASDRPQESLSAANLDKLAATPSLEDAILRAAAEKLRQEKRPRASVELQVTVTVSTTPNGCIQTCVNYGTLAMACSRKCDSTK